MKTMKILTICFCFLLSSTAEYAFLQFNGTIPLDAIPGGTDETGNKTYIAQIEIENDTVTATLYRGDNKVYAAYHDRSYRTDTDIKILCGNPPDRFVWNATVPNNCELIRGSYTNTYDFDYIGQCLINYQYFSGRFSKTTRSLQIPLREFPETLTQVQMFTKLMYCK